MTEEQVRELIISIDVQITRFLPKDFVNTIRKTDRYLWAISDIISSACYQITNGAILPFHEYDDLIKSELERISR